MLSTSTTESNDAMDRVELTLLHKQLVNICDEMAVSMMRTAYSPIFSEGLDFSTFLLDGEGQLVATAGLNPAMVGASLYATRWTVAEVGAENFHPGDVFVHNDPYRGGSHMPEHMLVAPVFVDEEIVAYIGNIAHLAEIGGMAPGSFAATATDIYQEGLRLPPVKLFDRGEPVHDIWRIILSNHRTPEVSWGDLHAMLGSLRVGERRLRQLFDARGVEAVLTSFDRLYDYAERYLKDRIAALPDGVYYGEDWEEDDGVEDKPYWMRLNMIIEGDQIVFDYRDSDDQAIGPINAPYVVTLSGSINGILTVLAKDVPVNAGITRAVRVVARPGSLLCVKSPGPCVGGQTELQSKIMELVSGLVLSQMLPEKAAAASGNTSTNFLMGGVDPRSGDYFAHYHFEGMGWGGRATSDGNNAQIIAAGNCRNTPVEIFETRWPWLHDRYALNADSGGAGRHRGGLGIERIVEFTGEVVTVSALMDRTIREPWGLFGGANGGLGGLEVKRDGRPRFVSFQEEWGTASKSKFANVRLGHGDVVRLVSPSGGGYGDPLERDPAAVAADVVEGFVSAESAAKSYGVLLTSDGRLDEGATETLRVRMRAAR